MNKILSDQDKAAIAKSFNLELALVLSFLQVETKNGGFLPSGRTKILFEGHYFSRLTGGKYDATHPTISYPKWTSSHYMRDSEKEYDRLTLAMTLDKHAALMSASWGLGQTMGENYKLCGFDSVEKMVEDYATSEYFQLIGALTFIKNQPVVFHALQERHFDVFAHYYNGPQCAVNHYPENLQLAYNHFTK
jgi:hypothetical protein